MPNARLTVCLCRWRRAQPGKAVTTEGKPRPPHRLFFPPPSAAGQGPHQWSWEGGEGAGRSRLRRRRGGGAEEQLHLLCLPIALQAEPPEFPSVRRSVVPTLRTEAAHHSPGLPLPAASGPKLPTSPRGRAATPGPPAPRPALTTRPGPAGGARRGGRRPLRARDLRAAVSLPPAPPLEVAPAAPQLLPGDRRAEKRARCPPLPPRRCHRREQRRQSRVGRAGLRSFPPRPPGRPPPARRPGQAGSSRESRARGPEPPGTPHSSPAGSALAEGGGLYPPYGGAGCTAAVATATRVAARRAEGEEPSPERGRPGPTQPGLTCEPRRNRNQEPSWDGRGRVGGALRTHRCAGSAPCRFPRPSPAPRIRQPPPPPRSAPNSLLPFCGHPPNFLYLNFSAPGFSPAPLLPGLPNSHPLLQAPTSGCARGAQALGLGLGLCHH